jgi:hypothetical protein
MKGFTDSRFPGMDPYLERHWLDVHASLVPAAQNALNRTLLDGLIAGTEERVAVDDGGVSCPILGNVFKPIQAGVSPDYGCLCSRDTKSQAMIC